MDEQDLSQNPRIARLTKLTRDLQRSRTLEETLRALHQGFATAEGLFAMMLLSTHGLGPGEYRVVRMQLTNIPAGVVAGPEIEESAPVQSGGTLAAIIARAQPQLLQNVEWSEDPFFRQTLQGCASVIAVPIPGDRVPMNWAILLKKSPQRFTVSDLEEALERVALVGALLENQILAAELARAHKRIDHEARQVGALQRALLPASPPRIAGLEVAASYEPSGRAGGDLYDFFPLGPLDERHADQLNQPSQPDAPARWCVFIADTAGHSLAAAVVMAVVQAVLHAHPAGIAGPEVLLMHASRQLCRRDIGGFVTAFLGVYEPGSRRLAYANAGHPPPLLRRSQGGAIQQLDDVGGVPLGIDESQNYKEAAVQLEKGDTLLLYTDGITEARGPENELFELDRLMRAVDGPGGPPAELVDRVRAAVRAHEQGGAAKDDQTLVAARVL